VRIHAIDHVQLAMPAGGEAAARAFYQDVLGLREVRKPAPLAQRGGCWFEGAAVRLHLGVEADFRPARKAHVALLVSGLTALLDACRAHGLEVVDAEPLDGCARAHVFDPFGNRLELLERT
jgi:catechol 2,3-dioxygenase-like lactoylglutathione lyase family enzyme